jgi:hypothetical protein
MSDSNTNLVYTVQRLKGDKIHYQTFNFINIPHVFEINDLHIAGSW